MNECVVPQEMISGRDSVKRTFCYTGLARLVGKAVPAALQCADDKELSIHTIIIYEDDPKLRLVGAAACQRVPARNTCYHSGTAWRSGRKGVPRGAKRFGLGR